MIHIIKERPASAAPPHRLEGGYGRASAAGACCKPHGLELRTGASSVAAAGCFAHYPALRRPIAQYGHRARFLLPPLPSHAQEQYSRGPEAWFIRRGSHIALEVGTGQRSSLAGGVRDCRGSRTDIWCPQALLPTAAQPLGSSSPCPCRGRWRTLKRRSARCGATASSTRASCCRVGGWMGQFCLSEAV